jgi:steroid 5-alpha reductase family enzyme
MPDFGEISLWTGFYIASLSDFSSITQAVAASISPIFIAMLLIHVSGINLLEVSAEKRWGDDAEYKQYKANVPVLIPFIGRRGSAAF